MALITASMSLPAAVATLAPLSIADALLHLGDAFNWLDSEEQLWGKWLRPTVAAMGPGKPLLYARQLAGYVPTLEGKYYYSRGWSVG